jgi:hypothetical protein
MISHTPTGVKKATEAKKARAEGRTKPAAKILQAQIISGTVESAPTPGGLLGNGRKWLVLGVVGLFVVSATVLAIAVIWSSRSEEEKPDLLAKLPKPEAAIIGKKGTGPEKFAEGPKQKVADETPKSKEPVPSKDSSPPPKDTGPQEKQDPKESVGSKDPKKTTGEEKPDPKDPVLPKKEKSPPAEKSPADSVRALIGTLRKGDEGQKVEAIEGLKELGPKAGLASRALCEAALDASQVVSRNAILALDNVQAELKEPVFILLVDNQATNHLKAIAELEKLGNRAEPAIPILIHQIKKCERKLVDELSGGFSGGWGQPTLIQVITRHLLSLPKIALKDPVVRQTISDATLFTPVRQDSRFSLRFERFPFRRVGLELLGELAKGHEGHRKDILRVLVPLLKESAERAKSKQEFQALQALSELNAVGSVALSCGRDGQEVLREQLEPIVKELQFHPSENVRRQSKVLAEWLGK